MKRPHGRPGHEWDDTIKTDIKGIRYDGIDYIHLAQNRVLWVQRVASMGETRNASQILLGKYAEMQPPETDEKEMWG